VPTSTTAEVMVDTEAVDRVPPKISNASSESVTVKWG